MAEALDAFLTAHAARQSVHAVLYAGGERLWESLRADPPSDARWGRFLVAMGEVAAERLHDDGAAARWFRRCLDAEPVHRDAESCVAAGYGQGVLWERSGDALRALPAYRAAAAEGFRCAVIAPATLRAAGAAVRVAFQRSERLTAEDAALAKQMWLAWTWLQVHAPETIDPPLADELGRQLCAFLLPEDDPVRLAGIWRTWQPHQIATLHGGWSDGEGRCLQALFKLAAGAADRFLADEGAEPGLPYRLLAEAAGRG
jgi:hypothetical protein